MSTELSTIQDAEILDMTTGETNASALAETTPNEGELFAGIALAPFDEKAAAVLSRPLDPEKVRIRPDGITFLPGSEYRRTLNEAFGAGAWALRPIHAGTIEGDEIIVYTGALYILNRFIAQATGEHHYQPSNGNSSYATSLESAKTNCLARCCKDLGIGIELFDDEWRDEWKNAFAEQVWMIGIGDRNRGKKKPFWRKKGSGKTPDYPWKLDGGSYDSAPSQDAPRYEERSAPAPAVNVTPSEGEAWKEYRIAFGKNKGTKLGDLDAGYVRWLSEKWEPKGMQGDEHIVAMLKARETRKAIEEEKEGRVMGALEAGARADAWEAKDSF